MSPFSALAVTRLAGQAVVTAGRVATHSAERFADVFAEVASGGQAAAPADAASEGQATETLGQSIVERIQALLTQAGLSSQEPLSLELSPLGDVYVSSPLSEDRSSIEAAVEGDSQLRQWLGRWTSLTGQSGFHYGGRTDAPPHTPW